nr:Chain C, GLU-PHE-PRO-TYR-LEU-LEU-SER-LEU-LEU-GLY-GLU-VAL-SER-PRO-GLN [Homo sapiens]5IZ0_E Chain E, GLU-PHE-PRO-TYR-LEU-LEU-SER-LEU-LEU-GLY-GLU-VAL-SER-PRO-GLN [Homo sapiens]5IZ0_F Chain F, GLU-PHE-PRO-TYR-LEU-LEU-SER-LEU-LEU-GLY-GLU-VAL-SER-PRO-GLN [Homo sapiens]5IZ0_H Chain H, GLU-PHE-PRO-TYR-LEU-LEU-SER-LEU-LEU-GLY-GLU-VAL-SER-PRO-GLN [Homo sapiens]
EFPYLLSLLGEVSPQ